MKPEPAVPVVPDDPMDTSSARRRRSESLKPRDDTDMPDADDDPPEIPKECLHLHWETGWIDMPPEGTVVKDTFAAEHVLEIALVKEFFEELDGGTDTYPTYDKEEKDQTKRVKTCQVVKTYFKASPKTFHLTSEWVPRPRRFFDHFGGLWPGLKHGKTNEYTSDIDMMFLLHEGANGLKMGVSKSIPSNPQRPN